MSDKPNMTRIQLGRMLKRLRMDSDVSVPDVIRQKIYKSKSKIYDLEAGKIRDVDWPAVAALAQYLKADKKLERVLIEMAKATSEPGWYEPYGVIGPFSMYVELESTATAISIYEAEFVNGLFQTEAYLHGIQENVDAEFRSRRLDNFWSRDPLPTVRYLLNEAVIRRQIGGKKVMAEQIDKLIELGDQSGIDVLVVPFSAGFHKSMYGSYTIMDFDGDVFPSVAYVESRRGSQYDDTDAVVALYREIFEETRRLAIPIKEFMA